MRNLSAVVATGSLLDGEYDSSYQLDIQITGDSDLLSRHLKIKNDPSCHQEMESDANNHKVDLESTSVLTGLDGQEVQSVSCTAGPRQGYNDISNSAIQFHLQASPANGVQLASGIQLPGNTELAPSSIQHFDENLQDLNILWGGMDGNFALEKYFPLGAEFPNDLISVPEFDIYEATSSAFTGPSSGGTADEKSPMT
ncbi:hypothetical protein N7520_002864 [Penicillium odoratum]|uniref:uncharacterized protein n=1 Tax=Penicillium odoratum TaxID=1167516 RepID=UPI0025475B04|nr:uncharacterized protein N7520_002864 [Penicillium odoratum]KAJ5772335.1 hypothetical protein N7520_002864 [Penicillium odoratum]